MVEYKIFLRGDSESSKDYNDNIREFLNQQGEIIAMTTTDFKSRVESTTVWYRKAI